MTELFKFIQDELSRNHAFKLLLQSVRIKFIIDTNNTFTDEVINNATITLEEPSLMKLEGEPSHVDVDVPKACNNDDIVITYSE